MKLRVSGSSGRLRLTQPEVARLREAGMAKESTDFGSGQPWIYRVRTASGAGVIHAEFREGAIEAVVPRETARASADSGEVAIQAQSRPRQIPIEKDLRCLSRPESELPDAYPRPADHGHHGA